MKNKQIERFEKEKKERLKPKKIEAPTGVYLLVIALCVFNSFLKGPAILYILFMFIPYAYRKLS